MMHDFLSGNRLDLIHRCADKVAQRPSRNATEGQLKNGIPMFLDQLIHTLIVEKTSTPMDSRKISGPAGGGTPDTSEMGESATLHGAELLHLGYSVDQVVHDYGDLCQAITDLAVESKTPFEIDEFRTLNRCLDNVIADAVVEFNRSNNSDVFAKKDAEANERLGFFAHELRNFLGTATLSFTAIKTGVLPISRVTGSALERSLRSMTTLIDRSLAEVRLANDANATMHQPIQLAEFILAVRHSASLDAEAHGHSLTVSAIDPVLFLHADRDLLYSAVGNLLHNAFKFTHAHSEVTLNAYALADRILIDVADHCGGLPPGVIDKMFLPFSQASADKSGLGLGLSIVQRGVELNQGLLSVRDVPGTGCVFTISLPRHENSEI